MATTAQERSAAVVGYALGAPEVPDSTADQRPYSLAPTRT
jgi:hypothetical protein